MSQRKYFPAVYLCMADTDYACCVLFCCSVLTAAVIWPIPQRNNARIELKLPQVTRSTAMGGWMASSSMPLAAATFSAESKMDMSPAMYSGSRSSPLGDSAFISSRGSIFAYIPPLFSRRLRCLIRRCQHPLPHPRTMATGPSNSLASSILITPLFYGDGDPFCECTGVCLIFCRCSTGHIRLQSFSPSTWITNGSVYLPPLSEAVRISLEHRVCSSQC